MDISDQIIDVLVIEDDDDYATLIRDYLSGSDYCVSTCSDLTAGLSCLRDSEVDAVLLDLGLSDAGDIPNLVRVQSVNPTVPVIVITSLADNEMALEMLRRGAQDYLIKGQFNGFNLQRAIGHSIERKQLLDQSKHDAAHLSTISMIGRISSSYQHVSCLMDATAGEIKKIVPFDRLWLMAPADGTEGYLERYGLDQDVSTSYDEKTQQRAKPVPGGPLTSSHGSILSRDDLAGYPETSPWAQVLLDTGLDSFLQVPLNLLGRHVGVLALASKEKHAYSEDHLRALEEVGAQIAGPIAQADAVSRLEQMLDSQATAAALAHAVSRSLVLNDVLLSAKPYIVEMLPSSHTTVNLVKHESGTFSRVYVVGDELPGYPALEDESLDGSATVEVVESKSPLLLNNLDPSDPSLRWDLRAAVELGIRSMLIVPLRVEGHVVGTIAWADLLPDRFMQSDIDIAVTVSMHIAGAIANCELHQRSIEGAQRLLAIQRLESKNNELKTANEVKQVMISNVSHELRTPLASILAFADMLNRDREEALPDQYKLMVNMIRRGGRQLDLLISDLLTMSRMQSDAFQLKFGLIEISSLVEETVALITPLTSTKSQEIKVTIDCRESHVEADRSRLGQVLLNILSNASKYSPELSSIEIHVSDDSETLRISITDHGSGMSEEEQGQLFERFSRLDNDATRSEQGTGIGLSIVKKLVALHHGLVHVESTPGEGSTFTIAIPVRQPDNTRERAA